MNAFVLKQSLLICDTLEKRALNELILITEFLEKSETEFNIFLYSE